MKRILLICLALLTVFCFCACDTSLFPPKEEGEDSLNSDTCYTVSLPATEERTLFVQFTMKGGATFVIELYPEYAPQTVENFQNLVEQDFYNGLTFHRICKDYMIQGGDAKGDGTGTPENPIYGEFADNGFAQNILSHERGVISMARRSNDPNSAGTQFFIMHGANTRLDGDYAAFGRVVAGMETIDAIASLAVTEQTYSTEKSKPVEAPVIEAVVFVNYVAEPAE